jgi:hypothetical protein
MTLIRRHPVLTAAFALALALTLFFAGQFVARAAYWSDPAHREQAVEPWMTLRYIGRSWNLDPHQINTEAGLGQTPGLPLPLDEIARQRGVPVAEVIAGVEAAILRLRARDAAPDAAGP